MLDDFGSDAKMAMHAAREAAHELGHNYIGTEHLLLGLCADPTNGACAVLSEQGVDPQDVQAELKNIIKRGKAAHVGQLPFTPRIKRVLELAMEAASDLSYIGTEHLLVGLVEEGDGVAAEVLTKLGVESAAVRKAVARRCPPWTGPA